MIKALAIFIFVMGLIWIPFFFDEYGIGMAIFMTINSVFVGLFSEYIVEKGRNKDK